MTPLHDSGADAGALKLSAAKVAEELTWQAAIRAEQFISSVRILFCAVLLVRFFMLEGNRTWQSCVSEVLALLTGMLYSVGMLDAIRRGSVRSRALHWSVVLDALVCFGSLVQTSLWPGTLPYSGILARPDASAMLVAVCCAGYRLSVGLVLTSGALNFFALAVLVSIEHARYASTLAYAWGDVALFACLLGCAVTLGVAIARRASQLVELGALASFKVERTRSELVHLMRDQHDARSVLNAATLQASLIGRELEQEQHASDIQRLIKNLSLAGQQLQTLGDRTFGHFAGLHESTAVDVVSTVQGVSAVARLRFRGLTLHVRCDAVPHALIVGGRPSLERVLFNLIDNAAQGDGARGAHTIWLNVTTDRANGHVCLEVRDDGPGFHPAIRGTRALSSKRDGSGLGLVAVANIVEQSGGSLRMLDTARGASVVIELQQLKSEPQPAPRLPSR